MSNDNTTPSQPNGSDSGIALRGTNSTSLTELSGLANVLSSIINIGESGLYCEPTCPICMSPNRSDAEAMWRGMDQLASDRADKILQYFISRQENISRDAINNHFKSHIDKGDIELRKAEYIARLSNLSSTGLATIDHVKIAMAAVMECLTSAGTVAPDKYTTSAKALEIKSKMVTSLVKTWTDLLSLQAKIYGELEDKGEMIRMPKDAFVKVFDNAFKSIKSEEDRKLINSILNGLQSMFQQ